VKLRIGVCGLRIHRQQTPTAGVPWVALFAIVSFLLALFASPAGAQTSNRIPRDITGIEELPPAPPPAGWPYWLAGALAGTAGLCLVGWRLGRTRPRSAPLPPDQWALTELERVANAGLAESGQAERFHTLVSDVIRRFLELQYDLRAPRQTTPEFLRSLGQHSPLPAEQQARLAEFLRRCDIVKFAPIEATLVECGETLDLARTIVQTRN
jgi:hypothetical protein